MSEQEQSKLQKFLDENPDIEIFEAILPDLNGNLRGKWIPRSQIQKVFDGSLKMPLTTLGFDVWGRDVESWVLDDGDADGICFGDADTLTAVPWLDKPTGQLLLSMQEINGHPCGYDARSLVSGLMARLSKFGLKAMMASEMEFHLFQAENDSLGYPLHTQDSNSSRATIGGNTYSIDVMRDNSDLMYGVINCCAKQNLPIDTLIKEAARSQYEINLYHQDDALLAADQGVLLQRAIRGVAQQQNMRASFMAKPFGDIEGNGMHVHCSLVDEEGNNAFNNGTDEGNDLLRHAIAGCLHSMKDCMLLFAPHLNSYRRFQRGSHAPVTPTWGYENRTAAVRVPAGSHKAMRIEHRVPGADANPYLVNAAIIAGMLYGIENKLEAPEPREGDASVAEDTTFDKLPRHWPVAVDTFVASDFIKEYFGAEFQRVYSEAKIQEMDEFDKHVTLQEYDAYL